MIKEGSPDIEIDVIESLWYNFRDDTCDCEGCREETDCVLHIEIDDDDFEP